MIAYSAGVIKGLQRDHKVAAVLWKGFVSELLQGFSVNQVCIEMSDFTRFPEFAVSRTHEERAVEMDFVVGTREYTYIETSGGRLYGDFLDEHDWFACEVLNNYSVAGLMREYTSYVDGMTHEKFTQLTSDVEVCERSFAVEKSRAEILRNCCLVRDTEFYLAEVSAELTRNDPPSFESLCKKLYANLAKSGALERLGSTRPKEILVVGSPTGHYSRFAGRNLDDLALRLVNRVPFWENKLGSILMEVRRMCGV
jgi:hypothetical protein